MEQTTDTSLTVSRVFKITPEQLWEIWIDPKHVDQWHRPSPAHTTVSTFEPEVGGSYSISMTANGKTLKVLGRIKVFQPPKKLVYSWEWEGAPPEQDSDVCVEFEPVANGTKLTLTHTKLGNKESVQLHLSGWLSGLQNITSVIK